MKIFFKLLSIIKKILWILYNISVWCGLLLAIFIVCYLTYCNYAVYHVPYSGLKFDREVWVNKTKVIDKSWRISEAIFLMSWSRVEPRCRMYQDIVTNILRKGMHISEIEDLLGQKQDERIIYCADGKTKCMNYTLGNCSAFELVHHSDYLYVCFDRSQSVIGFGNRSYFCNNDRYKFWVRKEKCGCPHISWGEGGNSISFNDEGRELQCPLDVDKW